VIAGRRAALDVVKLNKLIISDGLAQKRDASGKIDSTVTMLLKIPSNRLTVADIIYSLPDDVKQSASAKGDPGSNRGLVLVGNKLCFGPYDGLLGLLRLRPAGT